MQSAENPTMFQRNMSSLSSGLKISQASRACCILHAGFLFGLIFSLEDEGDMFLHNTGGLSMDYTVIYLRSHDSSVTTGVRISNTTISVGF
jgi:hypothetical protein